MRLCYISVKFAGSKTRQTAIDVATGNFVDDPYENVFSLESRCVISFQALYMAMIRLCLFG